jgi:carbamoyltransferase
LTQRDMELEASVQVACERLMLHMAEAAHGEAGLENLCVAGGVALNCVGNGKLLREGPFKRMWIQPAAEDAGGALGVAQLAWHRKCRGVRTVTGKDQMRGELLGRSTRTPRPRPAWTRRMRRSSACQRMTAPGAWRRCSPREWSLVGSADE